MCHRPYRSGTEEQERHLARPREHPVKPQPSELVARRAGHRSPGRYRRARRMRRVWRQGQRRSSRRHRDDHHVARSGGPGEGNPGQARRRLPGQEPEDQGEREQRRGAGRQHAAEDHHRTVVGPIPGHRLHLRPGHRERRTQPQGCPPGEVHQGSERQLGGLLPRGPRCRHRERRAARLPGPCRQPLRRLQQEGVQGRWCVRTGRRLDVGRLHRHGAQSHELEQGHLRHGLAGGRAGRTASGASTR